MAFRQAIFIYSRCTLYYDRGCLWTWSKVCLDQVQGVFGRGPILGAGPGPAHRPPRHVSGTITGPGPGGKSGPGPRGSQRRVCVGVTREPARYTRRDGRHSVLTAHRSPSMRRGAAVASQNGELFLNPCLPVLGKFGHSSTKQAQSVLEPESKHVASQNNGDFPAMCWVMLSRTKNRDFCLRQNKFELARTKYGDFGPGYNRNNHSHLEGRTGDARPGPGMTHLRTGNDPCWGGSHWPDGAGQVVLCRR